MGGSELGEERAGGRFAGDGSVGGGGGTAADQPQQQGERHRQQRDVAVNSEEIDGAEVALDPEQAFRPGDLEGGG
jgi:hypothetical protein